MSFLSTYPLIAIGAVVVAVGVAVEVVSRWTGAGRGEGGPAPRLARLSLILGLTLIILGFATAPD